MGSKYNATYNGIIFVFLFVLQQIISFVYMPFKLVSPYWLLILFLIVLVCIKLPLTSSKYKVPLVFTLFCVLGSFLSYMNGEDVGNIVIKSLYIVIGYIGFVFISQYRINLKVFDFTLIGLYVFFYYTYFSLSVYSRMALNANLFGHSSSNTISISLNIVLFMYYLLSRSSVKEVRIRILLFSIINFGFILIQNSRAGIAVAIIIVLLAIMDFFNFDSRKKYMFYLFGAIFLCLILFYYQDFITKFFIDNKMQGLDSYEADVRSVSQRSFFSNLNMESFLVGYNRNFEFTNDITRTFNAFLDFWSRYGIIPFVVLIILFLKRIVDFRYYCISLISLLPIFFYSFFESLWGATLWDIFIFMILFYSHKNYSNVSYFSKGN